LISYHIVELISMYRYHRKEMDVEIDYASLTQIGDT